jgi:hypothetical protein
MVVAFLICWSGAWPVFAQTGIERYLSDNCVRIGIDQCYSEGGSRFFETIFRKGMRENASRADVDLVESISYEFPADPDVLRWRSFVRNGQPVVELSSGVLYNLHSLSTALALDMELGAPGPEQYGRYVEALVKSQDENRRRVREGKATVPSPTYADVNGISAARVSALMATDRMRAYSILFFQAQVIWVLGHETGHHRFKHFRDRAERRSDRELQAMEVQADAFATRILVKLGYSPLPMFYGILYMAGVEALLADRVDGRSHPKAACRMADLIDVGKTEYDAVRRTRDGMNKGLNDYLGRPEARDVPANLRNAAGGC